MRKVTALLVLLASGCAVARTPFSPAPPPPETAAIYFYRPSQMTGRLISPTVTVNGTALGKLSNDTYAVAYVPAGKVDLRSTWPGIPGSVRDDQVSLFAESGKRYFVRVRYHVEKEKRAAAASGFSMAKLVYEDRPGLEEVAEAEAIKQIEMVKPTDAFKTAAAK